MKDILNDYCSRDKKRFKSLKSNSSCSNIYPNIYKQIPINQTQQTRCNSIKSMKSDYNKTFYNKNTKCKRTIVKTRNNNTNHNKEVQLIINKLLTKTNVHNKTVHSSLYTHKYNKYDVLQRDIIDKQDIIKENLMLAPNQKHLYKSFSMQNKCMGGSKYRNNLLQSVHSYQTQIKHSYLRGQIIQSMVNMPNIQTLKHKFFEEINNEIKGKKLNNKKNHNNNKYKYIINQRKLLFHPISVPLNKISIEDRLKKWDAIIDNTRILRKKRKQDLEKKQKSFELLLKNESLNYTNKS